MSDKYKATTNEERKMVVGLFLHYGSYVKVSEVTGLSTNRVRHLIGLARDRREVSPSLRMRKHAVSRTNGHVDVTKPEFQVEVEEFEKTIVRPSDEYPLLDALLARKEAIVDAQTKAKRYMEAANLLADDDEDTALLLMEKSREVFNSVDLTDIEDEYLRYAAQHG